MTDDWNDTPSTSDDGFMGGESYPALAFTEIGDIHEGVVKAVKRKQDADFDDGKPLTWLNGDPKYVWLFELEHADGTMGTIWVRGNAVKTIREATIAAAGPGGSPVGWNLKLQFHALGEKVGKRNPAKLYRAKLTPAARPVPATAGGGGPLAAEPPF